MKIWMLLISLLVALAMWARTARRHSGATATLAHRVKTAWHSLLAGIAVYFLLLACGLAYLVLTGR